MIDFSNYLFRPSSVGNLMVNPRSKTETLSETTKSYLEQLVKEEIFGRKKDIMNKYLEKGLLVEEDSLDLLTAHYGKLFIKNTEKLANEYVTGTPDIIPEDRVIDAKSSWDIFTFPLFADEIETKIYYWQGQSYMWLTGKELFDLAYCLNSAPVHMIVAEKRRQMYNKGLVDMEGTEEFAAMETEVEKNMTFDDIPTYQRVKVLQIPYDPMAIEQLKVRIFESRAYMNKLAAMIPEA